jgi:hypothetical protein
MTLVAAYERQIGGRGTEILPGQPAPPVPDKPPVILHPTPAPEPAVASAAPAASPSPPNKAEKPAAERAKPHKRRHIHRVRHKRRH